MYAVLIPAFNPDHQLLDIVEELAAEDGPVIVVDDGSSPASGAVFDRAGAHSQVTVLRHDVNRGKGRAIKTGLGHIQQLPRDLTGVVMMDADGQHAVGELRTIGRLLEEGGRHLIIGSRQAADNVPLRSQLGNSITRTLFFLITGRRLRDTQTGLRGLPRALIPEVIALAGERYEYEIEMLFHCCAQGIPIVEVPIQTRYFAGNEASHFRPLADSARVLAIFMRNLARPGRRGPAGNTVPPA